MKTAKLYALAGMVPVGIIVQISILSSYMELSRYIELFQQLHLISIHGHRLGPGFMRLQFPDISQTPALV